MSFSISSLKDLTTRVRAAFRANLPGSDAWLWPNNVYVSAKVIGGMHYEVMLFADYIRRQIFVTTADSENLDLHGAEYRMARRPAAPASGVVTLTATGPLTVDDGALFTRIDGVSYRATAAVALGGAGTLDVPVVATSDGKNTSSEAGTSLSIDAGVTGDALAEVGASGIVGGADIEDDETFRARILFRKGNPPHGGAPADYVLWSEQVSGVTRVFVERHWAGPGTVRVFPLMDDLYAHGIAPSGDIERVADYLNTVAPAGAVMTVTAPTPVQIDIVIDGISPDTTAVRDAAAAELRGAFRRLSRVAGSDLYRPSMPYLAYSTSFSRSWIWQAVANATGEERHVVTSPASDIALAAGELPVLGTVTFT